MYTRLISCFFCDDESEMDSGIFFATTSTLRSGAGGVRDLRTFFRGLGPRYMSGSGGVKSPKHNIMFRV